jgi:hypothetical protein
MINKNDNILKNKSLGRVVKINEEFTQITIESSRYYKYKDEFYPSVTFILQYYPKGDSFNKWLKSNGDNADEIAQEAALKGTAVHTGIEKILLGKELRWIDDNGNINYSLNEWIMILRFAEFWNLKKPKLIKSEHHIYSDIHKLAGTIDLVLEIDGELWILDIKTSNSLHTIYELQTAIYQECWNEHNKNKITKTGILWLNSKTRKPSNDPTKIQGKGWSIITSERSQEDNLNLFKNIHSIFKIENPDLKPLSEKYPTSIKLDI